MLTKWISVKIVVADENNCGKESCPHFSVRGTADGVRMTCGLYHYPLGRGDLEGTVLRCDWCMRAKEV